MTAITASTTREHLLKCEARFREVLQLVTQLVHPVTVDRFSISIADGHRSLSVFILPARLDQILRISACFPWLLNDHTATMYEI